MKYARTLVRVRGFGRPLAFLLLPVVVCASLMAQTTARKAVPESVPYKVLQGSITSKQQNTYVELPFAVPAKISRVTLTFSYTGKDQHTALDLGLIDPEGLRCWSGGNKSLLTVAETEATPSCLPGRLPAGTWKVLIGVPSIRRGQVSEYTAKVYLSSTGSLPETAESTGVVREGAAWYRGDLHMHTAHSDGSCASESGKKRVPCPVFLTVDAAARRGLDFIAITDHNTTSHYDAMRELTPYFDELLLIPGREITTFHGHMNVFGTEQFIDFRLGSAQVPDINTLLRRAQAAGGLISINHPGAPTGERCMGCGWDPSPAADMKLVQAVEAINSGSEEGPYSGVPFWERGLNQGYRLTAVGGSDNHDATKPLGRVGSVGSPTTVVYAAELSTPAILQAIHAGHVFVDLTASRDKLLEVHALAAGENVGMGDSMELAAGSSLRLEAHVVKASGASVVWIEDGKPLEEAGAQRAEGNQMGQGKQISQDDQTLSTEWKSDGARHWFRADVRGPDGHLWLLGNPVYVNWTKSGEEVKSGGVR